MVIYGFILYFRVYYYCLGGKTKYSEYELIYDRISCDRRRFFHSRKNIDGKQRRTCYSVKRVTT